MFYFGFDLRDWVLRLETDDPGMAPSFVLSLIQRLPNDSLTTALANGGRHHFGWGLSEHMLADLFDAINQNTRACGNWGKKPPKFEPRPRPGRGGAKKKKVGVADLFARFTRN